MSTYVPQQTRVAVEFGSSARCYDHEAAGEVRQFRPRKRRLTVSDYIVRVRDVVRLSDDGSSIKEKVLPQVLVGFLTAQDLFFFKYGRF